MCAVLRDFCAYSSQKVNITKSLLFVSPNTSSAMARALSRCFAIPLTRNLGGYLGLPSAHGLQSSGQYNFLLHKIHWLDGNEIHCLWRDELSWFEQYC